MPSPRWAKPSAAPASASKAAASSAATRTFSFDDGEAAARALRDAGIRVERISEVVALRLRQSEPGQLGKIARRMANANVNIEIQYSDHDHRLILVVDDVAAARAIADEWMRG